MRLQRVLVAAASGCTRTAGFRRVPPVPPLTVEWPGPFAGQWWHRSLPGDHAL